MNRFINYIKSEYKVILSFLYIILVFAIVFYIAGLNMDYFYLSLEISVFSFFIYFIIQFLNYKNAEDYTVTIEKLNIENKMLQAKIINERKDLEEYFLLWVHQIKTPITVSNLILKNDDIQNSSKLKEQIFYIDEYTNMAINYLKLKNRESDMDVSSVAIDDVLKSILKKYSMLFIEKHISLEYKPITKSIISDARWLSVLIEQIIANAIKYTDTGSISIYFDEEKNALVIKDTGIGIPSENIKKIFDRGYSGFNGRLNEKSSGLGLYLAQNIANLLNIRIEVESVMKKGSTFFLILPS